MRGLRSGQTFDSVAVVADFFSEQGLVFGRDVAVSVQFDIHAALRDFRDFSRVHQLQNAFGGENRIIDSQNPG